MARLKWEGLVLPEMTKDHASKNLQPGADFTLDIVCGESHANAPSRSLNVAFLSTRKHCMPPHSLSIIYGELVRTGLVLAVHEPESCQCPNSVVFNRNIRALNNRHQNEPNWSLTAHRDRPDNGRERGQFAQRDEVQSFVIVIVNFWFPERPQKRSRRNQLIHRRLTKTKSISAVKIQRVFTLWWVTNGRIICG